MKEKYPDMVMMASNNSATPDTKYEMNDTLTDGFGVLMDHGQDTTVVDYYETDEYKEFVETMYDWQQKERFTTTFPCQHGKKGSDAYVADYLVKYRSCSVGCSASVHRGQL